MGILLGTFASLVAVMLLSAPIAFAHGSEAHGREPAPDRFEDDRGLYEENPDFYEDDVGPYDPSHGAYDPPPDHIPPRSEPPVWGRADHDPCPESWEAEPRPPYGWPRYRY